MKPVVLAAIALIATLGACAMVPERNAGLEQARLAVREAQHDAQVTRYARVELARAQEALREADRIWRDSPSDTRIDHLAYLAGRRAAIAHELAGMRASERQRATSAEQRNERLQAQMKDLQAQETDRGFNVVLSGVLFETGESTLKSGAGRRLQQLAEVLRENPDHVALVEGFTDDVGDRTDNAELSERRAQAVRDALASLGVDPSRIEVRGYGEEYPVASNRTPAGRQQNRRVEIVVSTDNAAIPPRGFVGRSGGEDRTRGSRDSASDAEPDRRK